MNPFFIDLVNAIEGVVWCLIYFVVPIALVACAILAVRYAYYLGLAAPSQVDKIMPSAATEIKRCGHH